MVINVTPDVGTRGIFGISEGPRTDPWSILFAPNGAKTDQPPNDLEHPALKNT
jgi:hypothetical protein